MTNNNINGALNNQFGGIEMTENNFWLGNQ